MQNYVAPSAGLNAQQGYSTLSPEMQAQFQQWQAQQQGQQAAQAPTADAGDSGLPSWMDMGLIGMLMNGKGPGGLADMFGGGDKGGKGFGLGMIPGLLGRE